ncbi:MAG TPA: hypothetical protein VLH56_10665 [Dissulfurispiraceae bacterium]|nr:hypothetical protein [Dissulfurispiraceae bacterium]
MKSICLVILLIMIVPLFACAAPLKVLPKQEAHAFGNVAAGPILEHLFSFRNAGGQVLMVKKVAAT